MPSQLPWKWESARAILFNNYLIIIKTISQEQWVNEPKWNKQTPEIVWLPRLYYNSTKKDCSYETFAVLFFPSSEIKFYLPYQSLIEKAMSLWQDS